MSIMNWFSGTARPEQIAVLLEVERRWASTDVFVLRMPVGAGKSRVAHCICAWSQASATICPPTNLLVQQYRTDWPDLPVPLRRNQAATGAAYGAALRDFKAGPIRLCNYYSYLAHRAHAPLVVFDEAHRLVPFLQDKEQITVWTHLDPVPTWVRTAADLCVWARSAPSRSQAAGDRLRKLATKLTQHADTYQLERTLAPYRGHTRECIRLRPLTPRLNRPVLWPPSKVRKLVFLSATFHAEDLYDLGLDGRRVAFLDSGSPIPAARRPVVYDPVGSMAHAQQGANLPALEARLAELLAHHATERGVIHATYGMAAQLRAGPLGSDPRLVWHTQADKDQVYRDWLQGAGRDTKVLVGSGMSEGLDLHGDRARWQVLTQVVYPSRADAAVEAKRRQRPASYTWAAAREIQQAVGRVVRGPEDYGVTYIVDAQFARLFTENRDMFVKSFHEALEFI